MAAGSVRLRGRLGEGCRLCRLGGGGLWFWNLTVFTCCNEKGTRVTGERQPPPSLLGSFPEEREGEPRGQPAPSRGQGMAMPVPAAGKGRVLGSSATGCRRPRRAGTESHRPCWWERAEGTSRRQCRTRKEGGRSCRAPPQLAMLPRESRGQLGCQGLVQRLALRVPREGEVVTGAICRMTLSL